MSEDNVIDLFNKKPGMKKIKVFDVYLTMRFQDENGDPGILHRVELKKGLINRLSYEDKIERYEIDGKPHFRNSGLKRFMIEIERCE